MNIQFSTDKTITGEERQADYFESQIEQALKRYQSHITTIAVHVKDKNGIKEGFNNIACVIEARIEGRQPIAVTDQANSIELAVTGAIDKLKASLETILGKIQRHRK